MTDHAIATLASSCRVASAHDTVLNSECAYTFHTPYTTDQGIVVNLATFIGTCPHMALLRPNETGIFIRIVKKRVERPLATPDDEPMADTTMVAAPTKLGLGVEGGFASEDETYQTIANYSILVLESQGDGTIKVITELPYDPEDATRGDNFPDAVVQSADSIIHHSGMAVQQDLKVWELDDEPKPVSRYYENLPFVDNGVVISPDPSAWKCQASGDTQNLWLNLSDGYIGGGRKNWDGSGGSNGALDHFQQTGEQYPLVVKLGTITADVETADCYSYAKDEDGPVQIPNLTELLQKRGIKVASMQKTVKSTAELEVELNATYAFDAITEAGSHLIPVSGPGLQGLQNLGNSCYMNSVVQLLFSGTVPELAHRYGMNETLLKSVTPTEAPTDLLCQTSKLTTALVSGEFAGPVPKSATVTDSKSLDPKYRIQPRMFKHVVGSDHVDFRTGQQQDAAQYLQFLLEKLDLAEQAAAASNRLAAKPSDEALHLASHLFSFRTTSRLVCKEDGRIKYKDSASESMLSLPVPMDKTTIMEVEPEQKRHKPDESEEQSEKTIPSVTFQACLESWAAETSIEDYRWPHLGNQVHPMTQRTRFANFPRYLLVQIQRYQLGADWTPQKLEVNLAIPQQIDLTALKSMGPHAGENLIREDEENAPTTSADMNAVPTIDEGALGQLMDMGFSYNGCKRALTAVGGSDVEAAMNWVFEHNADDDFNDPLPDSNAVAPISTGGDDSGLDEGVVMSLVENLGCFTMDQVRAALKEANGAADRAADWLFSHMDDLDGAISALNDKGATTAAPITPVVPFEDGGGLYTMVGMISHIGKHTGSGHYVAHLKRGDKWVIFNDEKVALSESPPFAHAYIYLFQRNDAMDAPHPSY